MSTSPARPSVPLFAAVAAFALLATIALPGGAFAAAYRVRLNGNDLSQATPLHRSDSFAVGASNGTATFTGDGFAYPGHVGCLERLDMTWSSGLSGGSNSNILVDARATDFVITGPPGPAVPATLHFRVKGGVSRLGGFAGNGGHSGNVHVRAELNGALAIGDFQASNGGGTNTGVFTGQTGDNFDAAFTISSTIPVNSSFTVVLQLDVTDFCYGNVGNTNPGYVIVDAGNASSPPVAGDGLHLEEVNGVVMDLPAGYTVNSPSFGVADNHFSSIVAVDPARLPAGLTLRVTPNPAAGAVHVELALPAAGPVRAEVFDTNGRRVRLLADRSFAAGAHTLEWDGRDAGGAAMPPGVYFARVEAAGRVVTRRIARID